MPRWWFLSGSVLKTFRANWAIRRAERSDTRDLSGERLIEQLKERGW